MASLVISCCKSQLPNIKTKMAEKMPIAVHATICTVRRSTKFIGRSSGGGRGGSGGVLGGGGSYGGEVGGKGGGGEGGGEGEQPAVVSWLHDDHEELRKAGLAEKVKAIRARLHWPRELVPVKVVKVVEGSSLATCPKRAAGRGQGGGATECRVHVRDARGIPCERLVEGGRVSEGVGEARGRVRCPNSTAG